MASHSGRPSFCGRFGLVEFSSLTLPRQSMKSVNEQVRSEKEDVVEGKKKEALSQWSMQLFPQVGRRFWLDRLKKLESSA